MKVVDEASKNLQKTAARFKTMEGALGEAGVSMKKFNKFAKENNLQIMKNGMVMDRLTGQTMSYGKAARNAQIQTKRFKMEFLGIMFMGMALQRLFKGMTFSTTKFFNKLTEGQTDAGKAVTRLGAGFEFLKFTMGNAIAEFVEANPWIIKFLDYVAELIGRFPKLSAGIVIFGLALGTIAFVVGQVALGVGALTIAFGGVTTGILAATTATISFIGGLVLVIAKVAAIAGILALFGAFVVGLFSKDFAKATDEWARNMQLNSGIVGKAFFGVIRLIMFGSRLFSTTFLNLVDLMIIGFDKGINGIVSGFVSFINFFIKGINMAIRGLNKLGANISEIPLLVGGGFDLGGAAAQERIVGRSTELIRETPTISELFSPEAKEGTNISIETVNISSEDPEQILEQLQDEINRQSGGIR